MEIGYSKDQELTIKTKTGLVGIKSAQLTMGHRKSEGGELVVQSPGEYEVEGISVFGYANGGETIFVIQADELRILYLGEIGVSLEEKMVEELENIDVVVVEVSVEVKLADKELCDLIGKLEPYYVIPLGSGKERFITSYEHGSRGVKSLVLNKLSLNDEVTEVITFETSG